MKLSFPEAGYVGFLSLFFFFLVSVSVNIVPIEKKHQGKCIKLTGQYGVVFSCVIKKIEF